MLISNSGNKKPLLKNPLETFLEFNKAQGVSPSIIKFYIRTLA
jgi:hypothetical protein